MNELELAAAFDAVARALAERVSKPFGPEYDSAIQKVAGDACVSLCGGNQDQARTLWKLIVSDLKGYMPHAAAVALVRAANVEDLVPDVEPSLESW